MVEVTGFPPWWWGIGAFSTSHSTFQIPLARLFSQGSQDHTQHTATLPASKLFRIFWQYFKAQSDKNEPKWARGECHQWPDSQCPAPGQRSAQSKAAETQERCITVVGWSIWSFDHIQPHFSVLAPELPSLERRNWLIHLHYVRKEFEVRLQKNLHLSFYA